MSMEPIWDKTYRFMFRAKTSGMTWAQWGYRSERLLAVHATLADPRVVCDSHQFNGVMDVAPAMFGKWATRD